MIERGHLSREGAHRVGEAEIVGRDRGQAFDLAHGVVAHPANDATVKRRQLGQLRRPVVRAERLECRERALVGRNTVRRRLTVEPLDLTAPRDERARRIATEEREPSPALGVLDRLEQETFAVPDELHEGRQRRLEVGEHLAPDRHDRVVARQLPERFPRRADDAGRLAHTGPGVAPPPNARKKQLRLPVWQAPAPSCSTMNSNTSMSQS